MQIIHWKFFVCTIAVCSCLTHKPISGSLFRCITNCRIGNKQSKNHRTKTIQVKKSINLHHEKKEYYNRKKSTTLTPLVMLLFVVRKGTIKNKTINTIEYQTLTDQYFKRCAVKVQVVTILSVP